MSIKIFIICRYNFDDLGQAILTLFVLSTKDGWVTIMYNGVDAVGVDMQVLLAVKWLHCY